MEPLYTRYIQETFGPDGQVTDWHYQYEDNFNYAYDIIDTMTRCLGTGPISCSGATTGAQSSS